MVKYISKICLRKHGISFGFDTQLKSVTVEYKGHDFNYSNLERMQRKIFTIFMMITNPFGHSDSKLWLMLYGKKFNIEESIEDFIEVYGPIFKEMDASVNRFYVLKFDLDKNNRVQCIPVLNRQYIASFIR